MFLLRLPSSCMLPSVTTSNLGLITKFAPLKSIEGPRSTLKFGDCVTAHPTPVIGSFTIAVNVGSGICQGLLMAFAEVSHA